jgi:molybdate transport system substrate-binding protein
LRWVRIEAVGGGEAELVVFLLNVLINPRLDVAGPFPAVGVAANCKQPEASKSFVAYLMSPPAIAVIKAKGMNPG